MRIGIDASNIRAGGGLTHLVELLRNAEPEQYGIEQVVVWAGKRTLGCLPQRRWLKPASEPVLDGPLPQRFVWQQTRLTVLAKSACELLLIPGGTYLGSFRPFVAMSQNMLPFELSEIRRYAFSRLLPYLLLLRQSQIATFKRSTGLIFVSDYARRVVEKTIKRWPAHVTVVGHGVDARFRSVPRPARAMAQCSEEDPFELLYVSHITPYKHQWCVVEAVARLRQEGFPVKLSLVGAPSQAMRQYRASVARFDPQGAFVTYHGRVPFEKLHEVYCKADAFVFASSCESISITLIEAMAAGLPVACSNRGPMPEVLGPAGVYFDPEDPGEIAVSLRELLNNPGLRELNACMAYERAACYSWQNCAQETFAFLARVAQENVQKTARKRRRASL